MQLLAVTELALFFVPVYTWIVGHRERWRRTALQPADVDATGIAWCLLLDRSQRFLLQGTIVRAVALILSCTNTVLLHSCFAERLQAEPAIEQQQVIVVTGASGQPEYEEAFRTWAERWKSACDSAGLECRLIGPNDSTTESSVKDTVVDDVHRWSQQKSREPLWIVLIGHGTFDGRSARFNLEGPDISASEMATVLQDSQRPLVIINCTSCSAPFVDALSAANRVVVSATKNGGQIQFARFGQALSTAIGGTEADMNQDGQVSLLEASVLASRRTQEFYDAEGRLATEHAMLDDNGDGMATRCSDWQGVRLETVSDVENPDGELARRIHLIRSKEERLLTVDQRESRNQLESQLNLLRKQREKLSESDYLDELAEILLPLAKLYDEAERAAATISDSPADTANEK